MEFINTEPVYIRGWVGGHGDREDGGKSLKKRKKTQIVEFRVTMTCTCTYKVHAITKGQCLDRREVTVGAISGPYSKVGALRWHHFASHGFTWSAQSTLEKQTS